MKPFRFSSRQLAALAVGGLVLIAVTRWWWQPRAAAAEASRSHGAALEAMAITLDAELLADPGLHTLRWDLSGACTQVYALTIDESFLDMAVVNFLGRTEEHSRWLMAVGPHPRIEGRLAALLVEQAAPEDIRLRELFTSPDSRHFTRHPTRGRELGPAAPDFACRNRSWDLVEDALALGWPELPVAPVRTGDRWQGQVVGGRCHETPCFDGDGQFDHTRSCQARPWQEQLDGWLAPTDGGPAIAVLTSSWDDDGREADLGIYTSRELAIAEGRPLFVRVEILHRWTGVTRWLELRAIGECAPGGELSETLARVRASLTAPG